MDETSVDIGVIYSGWHVALINLLCQVFASALILQHERDKESFKDDSNFSAIVHATLNNIYLSSSLPLPFSTALLSCNYELSFAKKRNTLVLLQPSERQIALIKCKSN